MSAYEWLIGTRYLRSTHRRGFVSFVALMSVCGLMLGVATLIVVLSVMNGFERELRSRILAVTSHATIAGLNGTLPDWQTVQDAVSRQPGVEAAVPYIESQAMLAHGSAMAGANVRGVLPQEERTAARVKQNGSRECEVNRLGLAPRRRQAQRDSERVRPAPARYRAHGALRCARRAERGAQFHHGLVPVA